MKFWKFASATIVLILSTSVNAALVGRLAATEGGTDYQAYYDTEADITWLADANYAMTSGYDYDGRLAFGGRDFDANYIPQWINSLNVNNVTGWRLPYYLSEDPTCEGYPFSRGPARGLGCAGSEMGNLFYNVLGGSSGSSIHESHNSNYDLFSNIQSSYWYSDQSSSTGSGSMIFDFNSGDQTQVSGGEYEYYLWAVHDGDVSAVPVPAAVWLFGSGLIGLVGVARRKKS